MLPSAELGAALLPSPSDNLSPVFLLGAGHDLLCTAGPVLPDVLQRAGPGGTVRLGYSPGSRARGYRATRSARASSQGTARPSTGKQWQPAL